MEIRVLRYFLTVAREETITGAAAALHMTQPTLSRQIRELERELGKKLLERGTHKITLTKEGLLLRKRAEEIISLVDKTEGEFRSMGGAVEGDVYIGGGETRGLHLIAEAAKELHKDCPGIRYHLYSGNAQDVTERLDKGLLDFGLLIQPFDATDYESLIIPETETWGVVMRKDSPLAKQEAVRKEDLLDKPLIFSRQAMDEGENNEYRRWFGEDYNRLNVVTTFNLLFNAAIMVEAGMGYALTIGRLADTSAESALCFRSLEPKLEAGLCLVWKRYQVFSDAAEVFLENLRSSFTERDQSGT